MPLNYFNMSSDLRICRILNGMWQVSGAHGYIDQTHAIQSMLEFHLSGFTTWDLADHYGPAEDFIQLFRTQLSALHGSSEVQKSQAFTKWVPPPRALSPAKVEAAVNRSLTRMNVESLDLLQFHWWDYSNFAYRDALSYLTELQTNGKIRCLGLTNFDTAHVKEFVEREVPLISNQIQFSIVDQRPEVAMVPFCRENQIHLLTYGTVCGGLLSEKYLGAPEPRRTDLNTASLQKYKQMIDAWGGWHLFQELLGTLKEIADKHTVSIPNVATRYILDKPAVAGVIIGVRLGVSDHREDNARVFDFALDSEDREAINAISAQSRDLFRLIGDCGDEYRA